MLIVMGLPGAGKSTVLREAKKRRKDLSVINYGDRATAVGINAGLLENRDEILSLPAPKIEELQIKVVASFEDHPKTILDTHALLALEPAGFMSGLTDSLFKKIKIEGMVYIDASSEDVLKRRQEDLSRKRAIVSINELNQNRIRSNEIIQYYSKEYNIPIFTITNSDGQFDKAVEELLSLLISLGWKEEAIHNI